jgi:hypothetical protein
MIAWGKEKSATISRDWGTQCRRIVDGNMHRRVLESNGT